MLRSSSLILKLRRCSLVSEIIDYYNQNNCRGYRHRGSHCQDCCSCCWLTVIRFSMRHFSQSIVYQEVASWFRENAFFNNNSLLQFARGSWRHRKERANREKNLSSCISKPLSKLLREMKIKMMFCRTETSY